MIFEIPLIEKSDPAKPGKTHRVMSLELERKVVSCFPDRKWWSEWVGERFVMMDEEGPEQDLLFFYRSLLGFRMWLDRARGPVMETMIRRNLADDLKERVKRVLGWREGQLVLLNPETPELEAKLKALEAEVPLTDPKPEEIEALRDEGIKLQWRLGTFEELRAGDPTGPIGEEAAILEWLDRCR